MSKRKDDTRPDDGKPYGFLLILRALARAAIDCREGRTMAALPVLCVLAEYADQDGQCRVGQDTLAARLGVKRQHVNKQLKLLEEWGWVVSYSPKSGVTKRYAIATEGLEVHRHDEWRVKTRREKKAEARRQQPSEPATSGTCTSEDCSTPSDEVEHLQLPEVAGVQPPELAPPATPRDCTPCNLQSLHEETSSEISSRDFLKRGALAALPDGRGRGAPTEGPTPGGQVVHNKFGTGTVVEIDGNKLTVDFDRAGRKMVLDSFVSVASANGALP